MTKLEQNVQFWAGEDIRLDFGITDASGNSQDVTGNTASWVLADEDDTACLMKIDGSMSGSLIQVTIESGSTSGCKGFYTHHLKGAASGSVVMLATGTVTIERSLI
jgi:hypothetical protein